LTLKGLLPTIIAAFGTIAVAVAPAIQSKVASHPTLSVVLAGVYAIVAHWLPSPTAPPTP
jgi:hypothetical protein